jgi:S-adenosylmethionine hydrolase
METKLITLTTDFGYKDPFVGIMKGVILGINPNARIVDLSHGISPQDIRGAALVLSNSAPFFPPGTIHVAVVDPGVGTGRRAILIESEGSFFVGPDNGVLGLAVHGRKINRIVELANESYHLTPTSSTFHGRDIFAPVAAYLSLGIPACDFGPELKDYARLEWPQVIKTEDGIQGQIIYIDNFGNLITNVRERDLKSLAGGKLAVSLADVTIQGLAANYASAEQNDYAALINSWGLLEISCFNGHAHLRSGADIGDPVHIRTA